MRESKRRGMKYYDLGAVDGERWPTLTKFKRQFQGKEFFYMGNIDIPIHPLAYKAYTVIRKLRR